MPESNEYESDYSPELTQELAQTPTIGELTATAVDSGRLSNLLVNLSRVLLSGLLSYEMLNVFRIIHHPVGFAWLGLVFTTVGIWFLLEAIGFYTKKENGQVLYSLLMLAAVAGVYADAIGDIYFLFDKISYYDQILHFFAGGATCAGIIFWVIKRLESQGKIHLGIIGVGFFSWMTSVFFGVVYELGEYVHDLLTGLNSLVSAFDTANDLFLDTVGALFLVTILTIYFYHVSHRSLSAHKTS